MTGMPPSTGCHLLGHCYYFYYQSAQARVNLSAILNNLQEILHKTKSHQMNHSSPLLLDLQSEKKLLEDLIKYFKSKKNVFQNKKTSITHYKILCSYYLTVYTKRKIERKCYKEITNLKVIELFAWSLATCHPS